MECFSVSCPCGQLKRPRSAPLPSTGTEVPAGPSIRADFSSITSALEVMRQRRQSPATREAQPKQERLPANDPPAAQQQQQDGDPPPDHQPAGASQAQAQTEAPQQAEASQGSDTDAEGLEPPKMAQAQHQTQHRRLSSRGRSVLDAKRGKWGKVGTVLKKLKPAKLAEIVCMLKKRRYILQR